MNFATPRSTIYLPHVEAFDPAILREIEALEPEALVSLVSIRLNNRCNDGNDAGPPGAKEVFANNVTEGESTSGNRTQSVLSVHGDEEYIAPTLPPPPKKRISRKYIVPTEEGSVDTEGIVPSTLYTHGDEDHINPTHNILRRDILEVFVEAPRQMNRTMCKYSKNTKARKSRFGGKVGLRCRFCKHLPDEARAPLSTIYPETLQGLYRACCVRFQKRHLSMCEFIPEQIREELISVKNRKSRGSKSFWVESAFGKGLRNSEDNKGIIFCPDTMS
ncbi:hypothetical protein ACHAXR_003671 [Thalassiosira sp. AJA248-18]